MREGGVYPCPNFLALFQEVHLNRAMPERKRFFSVDVFPNSPYILNTEGYNWIQCNVGLLELYSEVINSPGRVRGYICVVSPGTPTVSCLRHNTIQKYINSKSASTWISKVHQFQMYLQT